jgi:DNA-directed RNA polymerase specialized sigma24 family protein
MPPHQTKLGGSRGVGPARGVLQYAAAVNWIFQRLAPAPADNTKRQRMPKESHPVGRSKNYTTLIRVVATLTPDRALREDLLQEAVIHLWQLCHLRSGRSPSWYFKSCQLHLLNLLRKGRSIDSWKRKGRLGQPELTTEDSSASDGLHELMGHSVCEESVFAQVSARDIFSSLCRWLEPRDRLILGHLVDGLNAREIASLLQVSHTAVFKRQCKIASVALGLGIFPLSNARVSAAGGARWSRRNLRSSRSDGTGKEANAKLRPREELRWELSQRRLPFASENYL